GIFLELWGRLFLPKFPPQTDEATLKIMTYNVLGYNPATLAQVQTIRQADADVVMLQELHNGLADLLTKELSAQYPYQVLDAQVDVDGMGVLSKFPLRRIGRVPELGWVGEPQWLELDWKGRAITLINFHMAPTNFFNCHHVQETSRLRREEARWLVQQLRPNQPTILAGDSNSTPWSDSYRILQKAAQDAWLQAGWGFGHTFPGRGGAGSSRAQFFGISIPKWLLRIDYIFITPPLVAISARLGRFDGVSDHRPLIATVKLTCARE
ncbi:MAG: endonuclease/exonuclease/phosphatase family protein, partial [Anaerolineales bacterium]